MYTRDDSSSSGQISIDDIGSVDMRLSAEIVGDYEVLQIDSVENGANDRPFTIYANHGSVTARINVTLTKRVYSGSFVIEDANGVQYVPNSAQSIVLTGLDQIHKLTVVEPNGDGRYKYSTVVASAVTKYANFTQDDVTSPIINCEITSQPARVVRGSLKVTCEKLIDPSASWTNDFPIVIQNEDVAISSFTNPEIFSAFAGIRSEFMAQGAILKTECQNFTDDEFGSINFYKENPKTFDEFQYFTGLTSVPKGTFQNCSNLRSTIIPANVSTIGEKAFYSCSSLKSITLPSNISVIGDSAFEKCAALSSVV